MFFSVVFGNFTGLWNFKWQAVSLLTKVVLGEKNLIRFTNGAPVMFHEQSAFLLVQRKKECPGKPDLLNLLFVCTSSLKPLKQRNKLNKEWNNINTQEDEKNGK